MTTSRPRHLHDRLTGHPVEGSPAALDEALRRVGDRWSLRIVDTLRTGPRRFGELESSLDGLAPNILSRRLKALEADGLVTASPYSRRPFRVAYVLTERGAELAGALRLLAQWGARPASGDAVPLHHAACGTAVEARWWCPSCEEIVDDAAGEDDVVHV
jgi:DNA-binding HxlR family transcriptional regulator